MTYRLLFFLLVFSLFSCSHVEKDSILATEVASPADLFTVDETIIPLFDDLPSSEQENLIEFYKVRNYATQFYDKNGKLSQSGQLIIDFLNHSLYYGLPQKRIYPAVYKNTDSLHNDLVLFVKDAQISMGILRFFNDLQNGYSDSLKVTDRALNLVNITLIDTLKTFTRKSQLDDLVKRYTPANDHYKMLTSALQAHLDTANLSLALFTISLKQKDSIHAYINALKNLHLKNFPFTGDENPKDVIKRYQKQNNIHADGEIGETTKFILEESPLDLAYRIAWNMEKTRYEKTYPKQFIKINIPEFTLYYFNEDTIVSINNVVVGKLKNQTPTLISKINRIQIYPYWTVPYKIATKEILPAVKSNRSYLERNQMEILKGDKVVDPQFINWKKLSEKNFPYKVRQLPGEKNSLGLIKFEFYNKYDVYVHDTPQRYLLNYPNRMYSHGCIRCKDPQELAKKMIEINEKNIGNAIIPDSLDSMMIRKQQNSIYIKKGIPIYVEYNTVAITTVVKKKHKNKPDEYEEKIFYHRDIYYRDEEYVRYFFGEKELISADSN